MKPKLLRALLTITMVSILIQSVAFAKDYIYVYDNNGNLIRVTTNEGGNSLSYTPPESKTFDGTQQIPINFEKVNLSAGAKNTVQFWMYWTGGNYQMPFSWGTWCDLYFADNVFGFNTFNSDMRGTDATSFKNTWVHVTAIFVNGDTTQNELYINGVKQNLTQYGTPIQRNVSNTAMVSGFSDKNYMFKGKIADLRIWNRAVTPSEAVDFQNPRIENSMISTWKLREEPLNSFKFQGNRRVVERGLNVDLTKGAKTTVEFWIRWDGNTGQMPFGWDGAYDIMFSGGYFGFNTGNSDVYGTQNSSMKGKWTHVAAVFKNGSALENKLYINGIQQQLTQIGNVLSRDVTAQAQISGWGVDNNYQFQGDISNFRIWKKELTVSEIAKSMYTDKIFDTTNLLTEW